MHVCFYASVVGECSQFDAVPNASCTHADDITWGKATLNKYAKGLGK